MIALRGIEPVCISWNDNAANSRANRPISSIDRTLRNDRGFDSAMADGSAEVEQTQSLGHCGVVNLGRRSDQPLICKPFLLHRYFNERHARRRCATSRVNYPLQSFRWKSRASG